MRNFALLFLVGLACVTLTHAQSSSNSKKMTGTVCDSSCVVQEQNTATCDKSCGAKSGETVLVDDQGKVMKIANQDVCKSHMGQHVSVTVVPSEKEREKTLQERQNYYEVLQLETLEPL